MKKKYYIGLANTFHDSAIAILDQSGEILFAEATERYLQYKKAFNCEPDSLNRITELLLEYCDPEGEFIVNFNWQKKREFYETIGNLLGYFQAEKILSSQSRRFSASLIEEYKIYHMVARQRSFCLQRGIDLARRMREEFPRSQIDIRDYAHHLCHAAVACYGSPFENAACLVADAFAETSSLAYYTYKKGKLHFLYQPGGNESLGFFYMKLTELCGFNWLKGEEWKVMGLAAYGEKDEEVYEVFQKMLRVEKLRLRQSIKGIRKGLVELEKISCHPQENFKKAANLAYTGQLFFQELTQKLMANFYAQTQVKNLVYTGGCALNSSFNGLILEKTPFEELYVPSAPGDDGTALGAAWLGYYQDHPQDKPKGRVVSPYLGSKVSPKTWDNLLQLGKIPHLWHCPENICQQTAKLLAQGKLVGWVQGQAEFGPRALGNRSILADPRDEGMKDKINALVKFREEFRPFAPSTLHEFGPEYFQNYQESYYMERTLRFQESALSKVPAVVHSNKTGRLQTVKSEWNPRYHKLIQSFYEITGVPIILNTSFNIMGKPIIHTIEDALGVFFTTGLDVLVIGDYMITKEAIA